MTSLVLGFFRGILYLQLIGCTVLGYFFGGGMMLPIAAQFGSSGYAHFGGVVGAVIGFLVGTLLVGYGLALLSINDHLARMNAGTDLSPLENPSRSRVEPQMRS